VWLKKLSAFQLVVLHIDVQWFYPRNISLSSERLVEPSPWLVVHKKRASMLKQ